MGSCTTRHFLLSICILQLLATIERQIFDFLGYMWAPILANFFHIIFVIFGFFGAYQFSAVYLIFYGIWILLWIGWNTFLICFYLNVGILNRDSDILSLGTGAVSWFEVNGYGCMPTYPTNITSEDPFRLVRPEYVDGCLLEWYTVEIIQSAVQLCLAVLGLIGSMCIARVFFDDDDRFDFMGGDAKSVQHTVVHPMYVSYTSIPTSTANTTMKSTKLLTKPFNDVTNCSSANSTKANSTILNFSSHNINNINHNNNNNNNSCSMSSSGSVTSNCANASRPLPSNQYSMFLNNNKKTSTHSMHSLNTNGGVGGGIAGNHNHFNSHHNINAKHTFSRLHGGGGGYNCNAKPYAKRNSLITTRHDFIQNFHVELTPRDSDSDEFRQLPMDSAHSRTKLTFLPGHRELGSSQSRTNIFHQYNDLSNSSSAGSYHCSPDKHAYNGPVPVHERKYVSPRRLPYNNNARRELSATNYGNEIRDLPPDYVLKTYAMKRTQSHDRLINQQRMNGIRRKARPKSYCSNGANSAIPI